MVASTPRFNPAPSGLPGAYRPVFQPVLAPANNPITGFNPYPATAFPVDTKAPVSAGFPAALPVPPVPASELPSPEISYALSLLGAIRNLSEDEVYLQSLGVNITFHTGQDALELIQSKGIQVVFGDMGDSLAHAQWIADQNVIMINQKYRHDFSVPTLYAISEAIYHEAGHAARLGDDQSSLQEEIDCLALNTLAYSYHVHTDPNYAAAASRSRLIQDGVALYYKLFFDTDPTKAALVRRIIEKYGELQPQTADHIIPTLPYGTALTDRVLRQEQVDRANQPVPAFNVMA